MPAPSRPEGDALAERVVSRAAEQLLAKLDVRALEARLVERALATLEKREVDRLAERLAGEASARAFEAVRGGLERIAERIAERLVRDAVQEALPKLREKVDHAALAASVEKQAGQLAAKEVLARVPVDALRGDLAALPERLAKEALGRLPAPQAAAPPRGPSLAEVEAVARKAVLEARPVQEAATERTVARAIEGLEARLPKVDAEALKKDLYRALRAELPASTPANGTPLPASEVKALGRELKGLKESLGQLLAQGPSGVLESAEFKKLLDARFRQVIEYVRNDLVPAAVRSAVSSPSSASPARSASR